MGNVSNGGKTVLGDNVTGTVRGKVVVIEIDTTVDLGKSASGKSDMVASTRGFTSIGGIKVAINAIK
jgi:hypothetical protein